MKEGRISFNSQRQKLWGFYLFTHMPIKKQALNGLAHFGVGLAVGGLAGWLHPALCVPVAILVGGGREVYHWVSKDEPHILDRLRDTLEWAVGGLTAWGVWQAFG